MTTAADGLRLADVVAALDRLYPQDTAMSWDQVGLVCGDPEQPVRRVHFAVDPTLAVIEEARALGADLLVTHHPLLLRGVHSVATTTAKGAAVTSLVVGDVALYVAHTNADVATPGVCDALAAACGLSSTTPLAEQDGAGVGRVGDLAEPVTLRDFAERVAGALPQTPVGMRVSGPEEAVVRRVAVVGGAGDDLFDAVRASGCRRLRDGRPAPPPGARRRARGRRRHAVPGRRLALGQRVAVAGRLREPPRGRARRAGSTVETRVCTTAHRPLDPARARQT